MAFTPNKFLNNSTSTTFRDQQHAARLFTDDQFRLAPKHKFLFHVAFSINPTAIRNADFLDRHKNEINMLVKSVDLPSFNMVVETLNQYNRKKKVQSTHNHGDITVSFHDDNMGVVNQLWQNYYSYYYADSISATTAGSYNKTAMKNFNYVKTPYGYNNNNTEAFFNYITIYQMARHEWVSYKLINPVITSWNHNKVDYSQTGVHDNSMKLAYEAVAYETGTVDDNPPEGFGLEHYDVSPSPLQEGSAATDTASPTFSNKAVITDPIAALQNLMLTINGYTNTQQLTNTTIPLGNLFATPTAGLNGITDTAFPTVSNPSPITIATQVNINQINIGQININGTTL